MPIYYRLQILRWIVLCIAVACLHACTPARKPTSIAAFSTFRAPVAVSPAGAPVSSSSTFSSAVEARFPDPVKKYSTPALQAGRSTFTSTAEMQTYLRNLVREGADSLGSGAISVKLLSLGQSQNGVPIEALLLTRSPEPTADALIRTGLPTVLLIGQQHGDEPAASEALLVLAHELANGSLKKILERVHVVILPRANPDGAQFGRHVTLNGIDPEHDHLRLETPEAIAQAQLVREFAPVVVVDAHEYSVVSIYQEKFGALQRSDALIQYASAANMPEFMTKAAEEWFRQPMLLSLKQQGLRADWSHSTSTKRDDKRVSMGSAWPDSGVSVNGLKNAVSILIETRGAGLEKKHLMRRVHTHVTAMTSVLRSAANRAPALMKLRRYVEAEVSAKACKGRMIVNVAPTPSEYTLLMLDPVTGVDKPVTVSWDSILALHPTKTRTRPCGYWLAADQLEAVERLRQMGVQVKQADEATALRAETYVETSRHMGARQDVRGVVAEGGDVLMVTVQVAAALIDMPAGSYFVPLSQPLANVVIAALEPDTQHSYFANRVVTELRAQARVMEPPQAKWVQP